MKEMVGGCCVCSDERGWPDNPLVYCDGNGCTVAVHQACYGIVTVPTGPWFCRKCESPENKGKVRCELCPSRSGALKKTDTGGWAHVVCALYIPEVRFGNVTSMEPIVLRLIPPERYNKTCYICHDLGKSHRSTAGACMQCNKSGCKQQFHVTCAQSLGLLCEEAGNYLDNVKYCGYCQHHYSKLKKGGNVKTIPPYKPVPHDSHSSDSSGEKEQEGESSGAGASGASGASGSSPPAHTSKSKGPGRKSSHGNASTKNTPASGKQQTTPQPMDVSDDVPDPPVTRKHKNSEKRGIKRTDNAVRSPSPDKKKSPARRGSSTGDGGGSKNSTPAPSPQHSIESPLPPKASTTPVAPAKMSPSEVSSPVKASEPVGVISSVASASASASVATTTSTSVETSVVQVNKAGYQESVITNTDAMDTKQTKKRKAVAAAHAAAAAAATAAAAAAAASAATEFSGNQINETVPQSWERDEMQEPLEKIIRRSKPDHDPSVGHFSSINPAALLPPPPPAHSPSTSTPRHLPSPQAGPSGMNPPTTIRSPSHHTGARAERDGQASVLVSVPLPSTSYGINLSTHQQPTQVSLNTDTYTSSTPSRHTSASTQSASDNSLVYYPPHPPNKQVSLESMHGLQPPRSAWSGLNVQYEHQHIPHDPKPGASGKVRPAKESGMAPINAPPAPMPPTAIRNKKRAAMSAAASTATQPLAPPSAPTLPATIRTKKRAAMSTITSMDPPPPPPPLTQMASTSTQSLASVRRQPQQTPPPPIYTETLNDSPPPSPGERAMKKSDLLGMHTAPHMLGNELNPESGVAARLQEQLTAELAAHAAGASGADPLVTPPLINKAAGGRISSAQSLDQLLERQWEQGSQFLMEQAQHFDIASLLSCLHQLRTENVRLEDHVANLLQRRDHLLAVNARLAIPLSAAPVPPPPLPPLEPARCSRENGGQIRAPPPPPPVRSETITSAHHSMIDQRSHQRQHRGDERMDERSGLRMPDGVVHLGSHPQRPVTMDAQLMMREVQQKPS